VVTNYFKPWIGKKYNRTRVLILSESVYSWRDKDRGLLEPTPTHPEENLLYWGIDHFGKQGYYTSMGRALCGTKKPTTVELRAAWDEYACIPFVQSSVGEGWKSRPTKKQWQDAATCFKSLIENLRPLKVIVTGKTMWNLHMPDFTGPHLCDDLQAYKLPDGSLVWCLAVPHPSSRKLSEGFQWERVGRAIHVFRSVRFPLRES
jgi:hypothetical protein